MVSEQLRIERLNPEHLANLLRVMDPPLDSDDGATTLRGEALRWLDRLTETRPAREVASGGGAPVLIIFRAGRPLRAVRLGGGALSVEGLSDASPASLGGFRRQHQCAAVLALHSEALPRLWAQVQRAVRPTDDLVAQTLSAAQVLRRATDAFVIEPALISKLPLPSYELLQSSFRRMLPDGTSLVFYLMQRDRLWTSLIVRQRGGDIDLITSHDAIEQEAPFRGLRDAPRVLECVGRRFAPVHVGAFIGLRSWAHFVAGDRAAIARAVAAREARLDPCPSWLFAIVGAGAVSEAATRSARLAGKLLARAPVGGRLIGSGAERLAAKFANPLERLGVDPWEVIRVGREWTKRLIPLLGA